jgi:uncharacterized protein with GYD domain
MAYYMIQGAYTAQAWAAMTKKPEDRSAALRALVKKLGGKVVALYHSFGKYDVVAIIDMPGNVTAAAAALAIAAGGHLKAFETTPLMTVAETMEAASKAGRIRYSTPLKKGK